MRIMHMNIQFHLVKLFRKREREGVGRGAAWNIFILVNGSIIGIIYMNLYGTLDKTHRQLQNCLTIQ